MDRAVPDTSRCVHHEFEALYAAHRDDIWRYLRRRAASEPEDLTTEVFLVAWRRRGELPDAPLPWLYGVARKVLANHRRGAVRRDALAERAEAHAAPFAPDPADAAGVRADLVRALAGLREERPRARPARRLGRPARWPRWPRRSAAPAAPPPSACTARASACSTPLKPTTRPPSRR